MKTKQLSAFQNINEYDLVTKKGILLADADEKNRELLRGMLWDLGFNVITASDGLKVINILDQFWLNGAILDLYLPSLHDWNFVRKLRERFPAIPVLAMADVERRQDLVQAIQDGAQDYIVKSIDPEEFVDKSLRLFE